MNRLTNMICTRCDKPIIVSSALIDGERVCATCLLTPASCSQSKYRNVRTKYRGRWFDSGAEAFRAEELDMLKRGEEILEYGVQPRFELGVPENVYRADFVVTHPDGLSHVEDVKGSETPKFRRDRRLWKRYGKHPLLILKRKGNGWAKEWIWPVDVDQSKYQLDWSCVE